MKIYVDTFEKIDLALENVKYLGKYKKKSMLNAFMLCVRASCILCFFYGKIFFLNVFTHQLDWFEKF